MGDLWEPFGQLLADLGVTLAAKGCSGAPLGFHFTDFGTLVALWAGHSKSRFFHDSGSHFWGIRDTWSSSLSSFFVSCFFFFFFFSLLYILGKSEESCQNVDGILRESLGTFVQFLGKVWEILSECLWNPDGISRNVWGISGKSLGNPFRILMESWGTL